MSIVVDQCRFLKQNRLLLLSKPLFCLLLLGVSDLPAQTALAPNDSSKTAGMTSSAPASLLAHLVSQAASILMASPEEGHCHQIEISAHIAQQEGKTYSGDLLFVRGSNQCFYMQLTAPVIEKATLGQGERPWMATDNTVFLGTNSGENKSRNPLVFIESQYLDKLKMAAGGMTTLALAPNILEQFVDINSTFLQDGTRTLCISHKKKKELGKIKIEFQSDGETPRLIKLDLEGYQGKLTIKRWKINTIARKDQFQPPSNLAVKEVDSEDLYHIYAALLNFAMELVE